jgi:hypothetical protein
VNCGQHPKIFKAAEELAEAEITLISSGGQRRNHRYGRSFSEQDLAVFS